MSKTFGYLNLPLGGMLGMWELWMQGELAGKATATPLFFVHVWYCLAFSLK
jgi:hypothetical protein